ncbi:MAG: RNA polymerase sigma factor [Roseimicrobium sp.]
MSTHDFQPTRWTLVARATKNDAPAARAALDELCRLYWPPLCNFAQRWGLSAVDAEDATQNFFAELLRNDKFAIAEAERGKLRTFLLHSFSKRLINQRERDPRRHHIDSDELPDVSDPETPEREFTRQWAITTMDSAMKSLAAEYAQSGKDSFFNACRPLLSLEASGNEEYAIIAQKLGIKEGALRVAAHRLRHRFREIIFATIAETLDQPTEANVRTEMRLLMEALV